MRCTMSENRLASLALMHNHYDMQIDLEEVVVELFATMHPRMVELSMCCDTFMLLWPLVVIRTVSVIPIMH